MGSNDFVGPAPSVQAHALHGHDELSVQAKLLKPGVNGSSKETPRRGTMKLGPHTVCHSNPNKVYGPSPLKSHVFWALSPNKADACFFWVLPKEGGPGSVRCRGPVSLPRPRG